MAEASANGAEPLERRALSLRPWVGLLFDSTITCKAKFESMRKCIAVIVGIRKRYPSLLKMYGMTSELMLEISWMRTAVLIVHNIYNGSVRYWMVEDVGRTPARKKHITPFTNL